MTKDTNGKLQTDERRRSCGSQIRVVNRHRLNKPAVKTRSGKYIVHTKQGRAGADVINSVQLDTVLDTYSNWREEKTVD